MYKRILVPLDGSEVAASVLPFVTNLAKHLGSRITLLTVVAPDRRASTESGAAVQSESQALDLRHAQHVAAAGVEADTEVVSGQPAAQIVARSEEGGFDLIAMGTRGHSGIRRGLLGSVTDEVIRTSSVPVLALSPTAVEASAGSDNKLTTITVPLDGSGVAEGIIPHAEDLARQLGLELRLLRVVSVGAMVFYAVEGGPVDTSPVEQELEQEASTYLNGLATDLSGRGLTVTSTVERGSPALAIIDYAKSNKETLVAICSHGRSGLGRLLIGSVADSIIRSAGVPVLVVTPQKASQE